MKKAILLLAAALLFSVPSFAQNGLSLAIDESVGFGFGNGPAVFSTTAVAVEYTLADLLVVGGGAGLRYGMPTFSVNNGTKSRSFELDLPIFARVGIRYKVIGAKVDVGYSIGLYSVSVSGLFKGGTPNSFGGFFLEPQISLYLGDRHSVGVGLLLQNGSYEQTSSVTGTDGSVSSKTERINKMLPCLNLHYVRYF